MQFFSAETRQAFTRRVLLPLASLLVLLLLFGIAGIFWIASYQTHVAIEQQVGLANGAFRIQAEKLTAMASDYGYWDDAVAAIVDKPDPAWMAENIGAGAEKSLGVQITFALDPDGKPVYSYFGGKDGRMDPSAVIGESFRRAFRTWKELPPGQTYSTLLPYQDTALALAFAPIRPFTHPSEKPTGYSLVFARTVDAVLMAQVARDFELARFRVVKSAADIDDERATIVVRDEDGRSVRFAWDPLRPGRGLLSIALPFLFLFVALLAIVAAVVLNYVIASAELLSDQENKASRDPLTGLANRGHFFHELERAMTGLAEDSAPVTVMYVDLDGFKGINDTMGHAAGDEVLVKVARRFRSCVRDDDVVARLGGDEFAILLQERQDISQIQAIAARILMSTAEPFKLSAGIATISCSVGIAVCSTPGMAGAELVNRADRALYEAKASGKNALKFWIGTDTDGDHHDLKVA